MNKDLKKKKVEYKKKWKILNGKYGDERLWVLFLNFYNAKQYNVDVINTGGKKNYSGWSFVSKNE